MVSGSNFRSAVMINQSEFLLFSCDEISLVYVLALPSDNITHVTQIGFIVNILLNSFDCKPFWLSLLYNNFLFY